LLNNLCDWLQKKSYLKAVKIIVEAKALSENQLNDGRNAERCEADMEVQSFLVTTRGRRNMAVRLSFMPIMRETTTMMSARRSRGFMKHSTMTHLGVSTWF
jgi:hypothetical protein